ncbi:uncharacterized protein LOC133188003 [Saccostrea echinata]|uniref:uncharacterized protein LOC133188003 n=1 Tax=Saccostrea echinata TaxID=191078 RepID=UPI002A82FC35|nr:uncharacterized protein LOC133188003 [Saccostrea echinata]
MEWKLDEVVFNKLTNLCGNCDIDLFASKDNQQLEKYYSYTPDPNAVGVDAFAHSGEIFPPFSVISSVLKKIKEEEVKFALLIAPVWKTAWFPQLMHQVACPCYLLPKTEILLPKDPERRHPLTKMKMEAFLIQDHPPHQNASGEQKVLQILTRLLPSLTAHPEIVVNEICKVYPSLIFPHPGECQLYYNCSKTYPPVPSFMEQHMMECKYPDLFSERTLQCENFTDVCCGGRKELKGKCSYRKEKDPSGYCFSESCVRLPDGMIPISMYSYTICLKGRLMAEGSCRLFEEVPYKGKCRDRFEVPITYPGGLLPSCKQKADGIYRFNYIRPVFGRETEDYFRIGHACDAYYRCDSGNITVVRCPPGTVFHSDIGDCKTGNSSLPQSCQLYCNPNQNDDFPGCFPPRIVECYYPSQFSERTKQCENFTEVNCGSRLEVKYQCEYLCGYWHMVCTKLCGGGPNECWNLPNGVWQHPPINRFSKEEYIRCYFNTLMERGLCSVDHVWGTQTYPYNGTCTQKFAIPASDPRGIGLLPDCTGRPDGSYQFITRPCDAYYRCDSGNATAIKCPDHIYFDKNIGRCSSNASCYRV